MGWGGLRGGMEICIVGLMRRSWLVIISMGMMLGRRVSLGVRIGIIIEHDLGVCWVDDACVDEMDKFLVLFIFASRVLRRK